MQVTIEREKSLETMAILALACLVITLIFQIEYGIHIASGLIFTGVFIKSLSYWITRGWLALGTSLGAVVNFILLFFIYYFILTPIAIAYRIFKKDLVMTTAIKRESYFVNRNHTYTRKDLENPW